MMVSMFLLENNSFFGLIKTSPPPGSGGCTGVELQDPLLYAPFSDTLSLFCRDY